MTDKRKEKALRKLKAKEEEKKELSRLQKIELARIEAVYVTAKADAHYYLTRYNMLVEQINDPSRPRELIDGVPKSPEFIAAEASRLKIAASKRFRDTWFAQQELLRLGLSTDEIDAIYIDYTEGKIVRDSYDDKYRRPMTAGFAPDP